MLNFIKNLNLSINAGEKIGIIGNGFVGKATTQLKCKDIQLYAYDIDPSQCDPIGLKLKDMNQCEMIFISVPTPMRSDGSCHLNIINSVLLDLKSNNYEGFIILRSTVPAGTCDKLNVYFMPEFLTEKNYIQDFIHNKDYVNKVVNDLMTDLKSIKLDFSNEKLKQSA